MTTPGHALPIRLLEIARQGMRRLDRHPGSRALMEGTLSGPAYAAYLCQVVHQVSGSEAMLADAGQRLRQSGAHPHLAALLCGKAPEERGHDVWALEDLAVLGVSEEAARRVPPSAAVTAYHAYTRYIVESAPAGVLGVAFVLEWFACARAGLAAQNLVLRSSIPRIESAVSFLERHGHADPDHVRTLTSALAGCADADAAEAITLSARVVAELYLGFFRAGAETPWVPGFTRAEPLAAHASTR